MGKEKLSDIDIAVALESINGSITGIQEAVIRIESTLGDLPCDDLLERIVKLEKDRDSQERITSENKDHIEKIYKITREYGREIATLKQENKGQNLLSDKVWIFIILFLNMITGIAVYFLTRGV